MKILVIGRLNLDRIKNQKTRVSVKLTKKKKTLIDRRRCNVKRNGRRRIVVYYCILLLFKTETAAREIRQ